ncbi:hypothetical protein L207DRAFT_421186 [Hyaloscypha variabilis F]|uniref:C2H2 type zinc finger domain protein n=1 Tax=Hyaloscypha variabilis (strain UAMH 11265 / GT02V1 / F) TaxID=1149755 RepID=A0A2J6RZF6_HYAVF|nr:hypothetical protein L207DRAFT_421186 [Hyaloscypha variabilis F]
MPTQTHPLPDSQQAASPATRTHARHQTLHQCSMCEKCYERHDHLTRHLQSHDNTRPFQCARCQKGFNRLDLLNRHVLGHTRNKVNHKSQPSRRPKERTTQACKSCVAAKAKCEDEKPCGRCRRRNMPCVSPNPATRNGTSSESAQKPGIMDEIEATLSLDRHALDGNSQAFADFFEQIMMPTSDHLASNQAVVAPPDVSSFVQDMQFSLDDFDFQLLEPLPMDSFFPSYPTPNTIQTVSSSPSTLSLRADAFQLSPWFVFPKLKLMHDANLCREWNPPQHHDSLSRQQDISIDEGSLPSDSGIFKVVLNICSPKHSISSFPSQALLTHVVEVFYAQEVESLEARVQPNTSALLNTIPELLLAFIAAGSVSVNSDSIQKMGMAFQEVVRLAVAELFERDNGMTRNLQALQAYMLWLDIGLWSGYKRSMEIAGSFLQPLYTARTPNGFERSSHLSVQIHPGDSVEAVEALWRDWLEKESMKRLAIQAFLHDSRVSLALLRNPLISYSRMNVPLPCSRDLWLAPDSQAWANMIVAGTASITSHPLLLVDVFANINLLEGLDSQADVYLCYLATLHATAAQVWDYKQHSTFRKKHNRITDDAVNLLNNALQDHLYKTLTRLRSKCHSFGQNSAEVRVLAEFLMMFLHVSLDDVQRFAGKEGESGARETVPVMREWCSSKDARIALWHAGQVLRAARSFKCTKLRGFHAVAVYFSALTLWVYGLIISDSDRKRGLDTPTQTHLNPLVETVDVVLDGDDGPDVRSFIMFNQGQPGLRYIEQSSGPEANTLNARKFCSLRRAKGVMMNAANIIQMNYPKQSACLPPMVGNLLDLMKKLGELSG